MYISPYTAQLEKRRVASQKASSARLARPDQAKLQQDKAPAADTDGFMSDFSMGDATNALSSGVSGFAQGQAGVQDFTIDKFAGLKGSGQGLASGGVYGAIAGGIGAQVGQFSEINKNLKDLDTSADFTQQTANGDVLYNSQAYNDKSKTMGALNEGEEALGKWGVADIFDPATKLFGAAFGTKKKITRAKRKLQRSIRRGQNEFNKRSREFDQQQIANDAYNDRMDMTNRFNNLYQ